MIQARTVKAPPPAPEFAGVVTSRKMASISAQVQGRIETINFARGTAIVEGQTFAQLEKTELETKLAQAKANEDAALKEAGGYGAQASALAKTLAAESRLNKLGVSSRLAVSNANGQYAQVAAQAAAAMARATTAKAAREQAEKDVTLASVTSKISGIVTNIKAHPGEIAQVGTPLARVFDPSKLIIRFAVPLEYRDAIHNGQRVELTIDSNKRVVGATVTSIADAQEPPINFIVVEADIDNSKLTPAELTVTSAGRVRLADARKAGA